MSNKTFIFWGDISSSFNLHSARDLLSVAAVCGDGDFHIYGIHLAYLANSMDTLLSDKKITFHLPLSEQHSKALAKYYDWKYDWTESTGPYELIHNLPHNNSCYYLYFTLGDMPIYDKRLMDENDSKGVKLLWCYCKSAQKSGNFSGTLLNMRSPQHTYDFCSILSLY